MPRAPTLRGFSGEVVYALGAECEGFGLLRSPTVDIRFPGDFEPFETGGIYGRLKLCFQQSTGDSAAP